MVRLGAGKSGSTPATIPTPGAPWEGGLDVLVGQTMSATAITRALTGMLSPRPRTSYPKFPVLHDEQRFVLESDVPLAFGGVVVRPYYTRNETDEELLRVYDELKNFKKP